jgi:hypothetical protein
LRHHLVRGYLVTRHAALNLNTVRKRLGFRRLGLYSHVFPFLSSVNDVNNSHRMRTEVYKCSWRTVCCKWHSVTGQFCVSHQTVQHLQTSLPDCTALSGTRYLVQFIASRYTDYAVLSCKMILVCLQNVLYLTTKKVKSIKFRTQWPQALLIHWKCPSCRKGFLRCRNLLHFQRQ